jgi:two-component system nitrogen regulation response regulator NtrX
MATTVLIVDDEISIQQSLEGALQDEGYHVLKASSGEEGLKTIAAKKPEVILLDIWMDGMDGLQVLQKLQEEDSPPAVIMMSGHGTIETAVQATKLGAYDFIEKPLSLEKLLVLIQNTVRTQELQKTNTALRSRIAKEKQIIGASESIERIRTIIERVAPTDGSVLITGENGTGKELVAHSIHRLSQRYQGPFVEVNCAAIPEELIESELFGHEKGSFTGATALRRGKFDLANGGTLFLDEVGDMSLKTQAKILRIVQEQKFERVGGAQTISVDVRLIAATNKDLKQAIQEGTFREDLYYRLNVVPVRLPALRERGEDVLILADHFLRESAASYSQEPRPLAEESKNALCRYPWPGNVRELRNLIERMMILSSTHKAGKPIEVGELLEHLQYELPPENGPRTGEDPASSVTATSLREARSQFEKDFILQTLRSNQGNVSKTASILGIERSHLHRKIKGFGIDPSEYN